jgi:hypothetical protein
MHTLEITAIFNFVQRYSGPFATALIMTYFRLCTLVALISFETILVHLQQSNILSSIILIFITTKQLHAARFIAQNNMFNRLLLVDDQAMATKHELRVKSNLLHAM